MQTSRKHRLGVWISPVLVLVVGLYSGFSAYTVKADYWARHDVEPGPEATRALLWEAGSGFIIGAVGCFVLLQVLAFLSRLLNKPKR